MRIRSIKPEFWTSDDIADLNIEDRLLFIGLWSYVDDNGVGIDKEHLIVSELFPRDLYRNTRDTIARVSRGLQALCDARLILRYEVAQRPYLQIATWEKHQRIDRPNKPRYPRYDADRDTLASISRDTRETPSTGTEEQGNRGTGEQRNSSLRIADAIRDEFDAFWDTYPIKKDKAKALDAYKKARKRASHETIMNGLHAYNQELAANPDMKIKYAQGWLNGNRWEDEPTPTRNKPSLIGSWITHHPDNIETRQIGGR